MRLILFLALLAILPMSSNAQKSQKAALAYYSWPFNTTAQLVEPYWLVKGKQVPININSSERDEWLEKYNADTRKNPSLPEYVWWRNNPDSLTMVIVKKEELENFKKQQSASVGSLCKSCVFPYCDWFDTAYILEPSNLSTLRFSDEMFLSNIDKGKNLSPRLGFDFEKASSRCFLNEGLINGQIYIHFFKSVTDKKSSIVYSGEMKNGMMEGNGTLVKYKADFNGDEFDTDGETVLYKGLFKDGRFLQNELAQQIAESVEYDYSSLFNLGKIDSVKKEVYSAQFFSKVVSGETVQYHSVRFRIFIYLAGRSYSLYAIDESLPKDKTRTSLYTKDTYLQNRFNQLAYAKEIELEKERQELARKIFSETDGGTMFDESAAYKKDVLWVPFNYRECQSGFSTSIFGSPGTVKDGQKNMTLYLKSKTEGWVKVGTWVITKREYCDASNLYTVNLSGNTSVVGTILNGNQDANFNSERDAVVGIIRYAKQHFEK